MEGKCTEAVAIKRWIWFKKMNKIKTLAYFHSNLMIYNEFVCTHRRIIGCEAMYSHLKENGIRNI